MAVTNVRVQLEFGMASGGWTETFYHAGESPAGFKAQASALVAERVKILSNTATIHHVRVSAAQPGGRSHRFAVWGGVGSIGEVNDVANVTLNVGVTAENSSARVVQFHGWPDSLTVMQANGRPNPVMDNRIIAFMNFLINNAYQLRVRTKRFNDDTLKAITNVAVSDTGVVTFTADATGLVANQKVIVSGMKGYRVSQFNGVWTAYEILAANAGFKGSTRRGIDRNFLYSPGTGRIRSGGVDGFTYSAITAYGEYVTPSTRRIGRPTDAPRGRR